MTKTIDGRPGRRMQALAVAVAVAVAVALAGCGGGSNGTGAVPVSSGPPPAPAADPPPATPPTTATPAAAPATTTLAAYAAARAQRPSLLGYPEPTAAERDWVLRDSLDRAVELLERSRPANFDAEWSANLALPALQAAHVGVVAAAARGDTLAELRTAFPAAPGLYSTMVQTQGVHRSLWARQGTPLLPGFLEATDPFGPLPALASWSAVEVADWGDERLRPILSGWFGAIRPDAMSRLVVIDEVHEHVTLPATEAFAGVFEGERGERRIAPMLRWSTGVTRRVVGDTPAVVARVGDRWLVKLEWRQDWSWSRRADLSAAIAAVARSAAGGTEAASPAVAMVLPRMYLSFSAASALGDAVRLPFDEVNANLQGLNGGGTYLRASEFNSGVSIDAGRLSVTGSQEVEFRHSDRNLYGGGNGHGFVGQVDANQADFFLGECPRREVDLRPFVLAVLDAELRALALLRVSSMPGALCYAPG